MSPPPRKPMIELPENITRIVSRGRPYYYHQIGRGTKNKGPRTRIKHDPQDAQFWIECADLNGDAVPGPAKGTFSALIAEYKDSPKYKQLRPKTKTEYDRCLTIIKKAWGEKKVAGVRPKHVLRLRDDRAATPTNANHVVTTLSIIIKWGIPREYAETNPCENVEKLKTGKGYAPWNWEMIDLAQAHLPLYLWHVVALALYTGQRVSDVLNMKWSDIKGGEIQVVQQKTCKTVWIPVHQDLAGILGDIDTVSIFILTNTKGQPWKSGFHASWQKQLKRDELKPIKKAGLVFHGLRKTAVVSLLEAGCTTAQVSAITGQTLQMVEHYAKQVNQRKLARQAIKTWEESGR